MLKFNQLQLYTEHTFAYRGHEKVWNGWSPLTAADAGHLAEYAAQRHIDWVPNQNSFGHMHRWLVHEPYRRLAECPDGIEHPFSLAVEPFSLCPTDPRSLELLKDLYGQLLPLATSPLFNANLDETLDLGQGRSKALCEQRGTEQVYLDFVHQVHGLAAAHGKRMMMWGDIILKQPELIDQLPEDIIALEWGYEADHPFAEDCRRFAASGRDFYVCPGTSAWSSFVGRTDNALANLASAAKHGRAHGAAGYLVTDWGDHGHLQPLIVGQAAWVAGACFSWNASSADDSASLPWGQMLDAWVLKDPKSQAGDALLDLGRAQDATGLKPLNGSPFFYTLMRAHLPPEERRSTGLTVESIGQSLDALENALQRLVGSHMQGAGRALDSRRASMGRRSHPFRSPRRPGAAPHRRAPAPRLLVEPSPKVPETRSRPAGGIPETHLAPPLPPRRPGRLHPTAYGDSTSAGGRVASTDPDTRCRCVVRARTPQGTIGQITRSSRMDQALPAKEVTKW